MTADEFVKAYAARSNMTVERLLAARKVVPCSCDYEECEGWGMVPLDFEPFGQ